MQRTLVGVRIRERRRAVRLKQVDLARKVDISPSYLNLIENNKRRITTELLAAVARALEVSAAELDGSNESEMRDDLASLAAAASDASLDPDDVETFVARNPKWSRIAAHAQRRIESMGEEIAALSDRLAHDPALSSAIHEMLTEISALRSTSEILAEGAEMSPDQRRRFEQIVFEQSSRLADSGAQLAAYFDRISEDRRRRTPQSDAEEHLERAADLNRRIEAAAADALGDGEDPAAALAMLLARAPSSQVSEGLFARRNAGALALASEITTANAAEWLIEAGGRADPSEDVERLMRDEITRRIADALILPGQAVIEAGEASDWSAEALIALADGDAGLAFRRLACLADGAAPRSAHISVDASGQVIGRRGALDLTPRSRQLDCPVWPAHRVSGSERRQAMVRSPDDQIAFALAVGAGGESGGADMLLIDPAFLDRTTYRTAARGDALAVGPDCRICAHDACPFRREPSVITRA